MNLRVVFDTSTLVSAAILADSAPRRALELAFAQCEIYASVDTLGELERVLLSKKFDRYLDRTHRAGFIEILLSHTHQVSVSEAHRRAVDPRCRDPKDDPILALAIAAEVGTIVTSDDDLLVMHPWQGVNIMTPSDFLSRGRMSSFEGV